MYLFAGSNDKLPFQVMKNDHVIVDCEHCRMGLSDSRLNLYFVYQIPKRYRVGTSNTTIYYGVGYFVLHFCIVVLCIDC